jgi:hypothetical protein
MKINLTFAVAGETFPDLHPHVQSGAIDAGYTWPGVVVGKYTAATLFAGTPVFLIFLVILPGCMPTEAENCGRRYMETH